MIGKKKLKKGFGEISRQMERGKKQQTNHNFCFLFFVFNAVEKASCEVHKLLGTGEVPTKPP